MFTSAQNPRVILTVNFLHVVFEGSNFFCLFFHNKHKLCTLGFNMDIIFSENRWLLAYVIKTK